ncbi:MAG TPA: beta-ketoacyl-ACP synthase [Methylibium sp.]|nr:beta-ketoacyl-ACP synthase [Methylibium sp.]
MPPEPSAAHRRATEPLGVAAWTAVHAAGHGSAALWDAIAQGRTGLRPNALSWCDRPCWVGEVPGVDDAALPAPLARWDCRNHRLAWLALQAPAFRQAVDAAVDRHGAHRVALVLGTSTSGIGRTEQAYAERRATGKWPPGFDYRMSHAVDALCRFSAELLGLQGPMVVISTACSSSAKVFLTARRWIDAGLVDAAVVGGADSLCLSTLHGFDALQLLSERVCRPFDAARDGISIGEAAGFMLIDRRPAAVSFLGGGESSDAWHMSTPHPQGLGAQDAMRAALAAAGLAPADIGYVNAHGTATPANDRSEAAALAAVFGPRGVPVSSTKGITGHTLGAAGIVEAIVTVEALARQALPATANLEQPDPALEVDLVLQPRGAALRRAMSNNFGFGGSNCALVFGRTD